MGHPRVGVAILTMGTRPAELDALLASVAAQETPAVRVVVVGNGAPLPELPDGVDGVELPENLGIAGGRNVALGAAAGVRGRGRRRRPRRRRLLRRHRRAQPDRRPVRRRPAARHRRLPDRGPRRGRPSAGTCRGCGRPTRCGAGSVTTFLGGGHALSMRDAGRDRRLARASSSTRTRRPTWPGGRSTPAGGSGTRPSCCSSTRRPRRRRHAVYYRMNARNRVWLAGGTCRRRSSPSTSGCGLVLTAARTRSAAGLRAWFGGFAEGGGRPARRGGRCGGGRYGG